MISWWLIHIFLPPSPPRHLCSTETFWESDDSDNMKTKYINVHVGSSIRLAEISVFIDLGRDRDYQLKSIALATVPAAAASALLPNQQPTPDQFTVASEIQIEMLKVRFSSCGDSRIGQCTVSIHSLLSRLDGSAFLFPTQHAHTLESKSNLRIRRYVRCHNVR